jgi:hypothetical protein
VFRFLDSYTGPLAVDRASVDGTLETADVIRQCRDKITSAFIVLPGKLVFAVLAVIHSNVHCLKNIAMQC